MDIDLANQNRKYIEKISSECSIRSLNYDKKASFLLTLYGILTLLIIVLSGVSTYLGNSTSDSASTIRTVFSATVSVVGLINMKFHFYKRGYKYKKSAVKIRDLGRNAERLAFANLTPIEISAKLENIFDNLDSIKISLYSEGDNVNSGPASDVNSNPNNDEVEVDIN